MLEYYSSNIDMQNVNILSYLVVFIKKINALDLPHWYFTGKFTNFLKQQKHPTEVLCKKGAFNNFAVFLWNTCVGVSLQAFRPATLLRGSNTNVFLWILRNFLEHLFWRTFENDCFLNRFSKENQWAAASVSLNLANLSPHYKQYEISSQTGSFEFLEQINPKRVVPS